MKTFKFILFLAIMLNGTFLFAQTEVPSGLVSGTWTQSGSPYLIQGSIQIADGNTLIIEPGVRVEFQGPYKLNVKGRLLAIGTLQDSIVFTKDTSLNTPYDPMQPTLEDSTYWRGIVLDNVSTSNDTSKLVYCKIEFINGSQATTCYGGITLNNYSKVIISHNTISNCSGNVYGAGIYCYNGASPVISYNLITNNPKAGIYCDYGCSSLIIYNKISNNSGSGIYCWNSTATISNNIIVNNTATNGGGICCEYYSTPTIINNVIANNSASYGGGLYFHNTNTNQNPNIYNTIVFGNTVTVNGGGSQVYLGDEENDPNFYYCDVQYGTSMFALNGTIYTGTYLNNINTDPLFVSPSAGSGKDYNGVTADWSLQSTSPCIDAGDPSQTYVATDIAGNPRVSVCRVDMGAYEYPLGDMYYITVSLQQPILCHGASTGEAEVSVTGGTSPYTYLWSNGQSTAKATGLAVGTYTVTVTSADGCSLEKSITLTEPTNIAVDAGSDKTVVCNDAVQLEALPAWVSLTSGTTQQLYSVFFTSADKGFAVGDQVTLETTDGGVNWTQISDLGISRLHSVYFVDANNGFTVGEYGVIGRTTDGGNSWTVGQDYGTSYNLNSVYFPNITTGYIVGSGGLIMKSVDGGASWSSQTSGTTSELNSVFFVNESIGYAVGYNGIILKTTNSGTTWTAKTISSVNRFKSVYFTSTNIGYIVGSGNSGGAIYKTTDAGSTWNALPITTSNEINSICFTDANTGYIATNYNPGTQTGIILKTTDGGTTWESLACEATYNINAVHFADDNTGYAVGWGGYIYKLYGDYQYSWSPTTGLSNGAIQNPIASPTTDTKYYVTATTPDGCTVTDSLTVTVTPLTVTGTDESITCGESVTLSITTNYSGTDNLTYSWTPSTGLSDATIANPICTVSGDQQYTIIITTPSGCTASDDLLVSVAPMNAPEICIVSVDSTNKNLVVWSKPVSSNIDSFYVYRETNITDVYQKIGAVHYDSLSIFRDATSDPDVQSNKYKLSIHDNCGLESSLSDYHKTMHLSINKGTGETWNLIWEEYEGFTVSTYNIYRGTSEDDLVQIGTSSGSNTQYSDLSAPTGDVYYQVEVISPNSCGISKSKNSLATYNSSRSNIASSKNTGVGSETSTSANFIVYPNPARTTVSVVKKFNEDCILNIYNALGSLVKTELLKQNEAELDISSLTNGIYLIEIKSDNYSENIKLMVQR